MTENEKAQIAEYSIEQVFASGNDQYLVPLYQREYAWGKNEVERLLNDLFLSFKEDASRNYYLGSIVVRRDVGAVDHFEVVDGQQRLITLSLLYALCLNDSQSDKVLRFQLRPDADKYIDACYDNKLQELDFENQDTDAFANAIGVIRSFYPETLDEGEKKLGENQDSIELVLAMENAGVSFKDYLLKKVILFRIELPGSTDVNSYFEIMNNRGEQLQYHEIMKAELLAMLHAACQRDSALGNYDELAAMFDDIWTACSRMNGYVGHHLHMCSKYLSRPERGWIDSAEWKKYLTPLSNAVDKTGETLEQSVIWDFANFLMHVMKCYQKKYIPGSNVTVTLDERDMQVKYEALKEHIDPVLFLDLLMRLRLKFDKYVVKAENDANGDIQAWHLSYVEKYKKSYDTVNTFKDVVQARIICFESMLQVSFNTQRNKDWLQYILELDDEVLCDGEKFLETLKKWARERLVNFKIGKENSGKDFYRLGLESSRFMLNLADYLMWENHISGSAGERYDVPDEFVFKYFNSVEHHHPQHDDQLPHDQRWSKEQIDDIGNLFLVYGSENASMNNREPQSKKNRFLAHNGGLLPTGPKRRWMYEHTYDDGRGWSLDDMESLSGYVQGLMNKFLGL